jgi:hypothetical protein
VAKSSNRSKNKITIHTHRGEAKKQAEMIQAPFANKKHEDAVLDIFDDRDFYVQLLKEVRSGGAGVLSQQDEEKQLLAEIQGPGCRASATTEGKMWWETTVGTFGI